MKLGIHKSKARIGVGYMGKVFQYGTALGPDGAKLKDSQTQPGFDARVKQLNKNPAMRRAGKKAARRADLRYENS